MITRTGVEIHRIKFYAHSSPLVNNIFTACLLISRNFEIISRGISICSLADQYNKSYGKDKAFGRAIKAISKERSFDKITKASSDDCVVRRFKFKNEQDAEVFCQKIHSINNVNANSGSSSYHFIEMRVLKLDGSSKKVVQVYIPRWYTLNETARYFSYKAELFPEVVEIFEKKILDDLKKV